jgi:hypothetical protein
VPATWSTFQPALKEVWTQEEFEAQLYDDHPFLDDIEKTDRYTVGEYAIVPIWTNRNGGFTVTGTAGSAALNAAGNVGLNQAQYALAFNYQQVKVDHPAIAVSQGNSNAIAGVLDTEFEGASSNMRTQITRQVYQNQTALITQCVASSSGQAVLGLNTVDGYDALTRGWLDTGATIDIGTTANETAVDADKVISSISLSSTTPTVTLTTNLSNSVTTSHYVSVANARSGSTSLEMNGLGNIISQSASLGGIAAGGRWQAAAVDTATTDLTLSSMLTIQSQVAQNTRSTRQGLRVLTGYVQGRRFYEQFQNQVRFNGDGVEAGSTDDIKWNGMVIRQDADCPSTKMFFYRPDHLLMVKSPLGMHWANEITGGEKVTWAQNTTGFVGLLAYPCNLAAKRRNGMAALTSLT